METAKLPLLMYDADCAFCVYWAQYWQKLTAGRVDFAPYQQAAPDYPAIPLENFRRAVQYVAPDGKVASAAEASFLTLSHAPGLSFWLLLYRRLPGFAALAEFVYAFIAKRRGWFYRPSLWLWGRNPEPPRYELMSWLFLRGLGLVFLSAFLSFAVQARGLIGADGILPLGDFLQAIENHAGVTRFFLLPMVFWFGHSDAAIDFACYAGAAAAAALTLNVLPRLSLVVLYALYLSLLYAGQTFMSFQWDTFLIETGVLGLVLTLNRRWGVFLLRWLLFRFMFLSGTCKLMSGDPHWADLTALTYHFPTQPLPTPLAVYAYEMPESALVFATGAALFVELVFPWFIFLPRRLRFIAGYGFLLLEILIFLTGNYNFFNLQTMLICLPLYDDQALLRLLQRFNFPRFLQWLTARRQKDFGAPRARKAARGAACLLAALILFTSGVQMLERFGSRPPVPLMTAKLFLEPLQLTSAYGLFAVMTIERNEIIIEGSDDGETWKEYGFRYKPGDLARGPRWNIPHQPRLDWQMWFASLESPNRLPWFQLFLRRLLQNSPAVLGLMADNPFPDHPPRYVRAQFYAYHFGAPEDRAKGQYWTRDLLGAYFGRASLTPQE
jgi:predicted DCC family thiol-disulfide oxidoreductase YuxK